MKIFFLIPLVRKEKKPYCDLRLNIDYILIHFCDLTDMGGGFSLKFSEWDRRGSITITMSKNRDFCFVLRGGDVCNCPLTPHCWSSLSKLNVLSFYEKLLYLSLRFKTCTFFLLYSRRMMFM